MFMISVLKRLLRLDSYTVYCETESKPIIMVNGLPRALYLPTDTSYELMKCMLWAIMV